MKLPILIAQVFNELSPHLNVLKQGMLLRHKLSSFNSAFFSISTHSRRCMSTLHSGIAELLWMSNLRRFGQSPDLNTIFFTELPMVKIKSLCIRLISSSIRLLKWGAVNVRSPSITQSILILIFMSYRGYTAVQERASALLRWASTGYSRLHQTLWKRTHFKKSSLQK